MGFQIGELSEEHQKYNRKTQIHTHTHTLTHTYTQEKRLPPAEAVKKVHMLHKCLSTLIFDKI